MADLSFLLNKSKRINRAFLKIKKNNFHYFNRAFRYYNIREVKAGALTKAKKESEMEKTKKGLFVGSVAEEESIVKNWNTFKKRWLQKRQGTVREPYAPYADEEYLMERNKIPYRIYNIPNEVPVLNSSSEVFYSVAGLGLAMPIDTKPTYNEKGEVIYFTNQSV